MNKLDVYSSSFKISVYTIFLAMITVGIMVITGYKEYAKYAIAFGLGAATVGIGSELEKLLSILLIFINHKNTK